MEWKKGFGDIEKGETKEGPRSCGENGKFQKGSECGIIGDGWAKWVGQKTFCDVTVLYFVELTLTTGPGTTFKDTT